MISDLEAVIAQPKGGHGTADDKPSPAAPARGATDSDDDSDDEKNPFSNPAVAERWIEQYEQSKYECRHVFDPALTWTDEEERALVRKLDWRVCLWAV